MTVRITDSHPKSYCALAGCGSWSNNMKDKRPEGLMAKLFYVRSRHCGRAGEFSPRVRTSGHFQSSYFKNSSISPAIKAVSWMISADQNQVIYIGPVSQLTDRFSVESACPGSEQNRSTLGLQEQLRNLIQRHARDISENCELLSTEYDFRQPGSLSSTIKLSSWPVRDDKDLVLFRAGIAIVMTNQGIGSTSP